MAARIHIARLLPLIAAALWVSSCARLETVTVLARTLVVEGEAMLVRNGENTPRHLTGDQRLATGDTIRTGPNGKVIISLLPGIRATLLGDSELTIGKLELRKSGEVIEDPVRDRRAEVALTRGALCGSVGDLAGEMTALLTVTTSAGAFDAGSAAVFFLRSRDNRSRIACAAEQVEARLATGQIVVIDAGQSQEMGTVSDEEPREVAPASPEAEEIEIAREADRRAAELEKRRRNELPRPAAQ